MAPPSPRRRHRLAGAALPLLALLPAGAMAAGAAGCADLLPAAEFAIELPAQPLSTALLSLGQQAGFAISADAALLQGLSAPALAGRLRPAEALDRLLRPAGLGCAPLPAGGITLRRGSPATALEGVTALPELPVTARPLAPGGAWPVLDLAATAGSKAPTPLLELPQSVSLVPQAQIAARGAQSVSAALRYLPGVQAEPYGADTRYDQVKLRGFDAHGLGDYRDGLRQPANSFAYFRTEPFGLERIEVLRGPSSMLYGQNAPGGLIDRISKQPPDQPLHELALAYGSRDRRQASIDLGGPLNEAGALAYRLTGLARAADNAQYKSMPDDRLYLAPSLRWRPDGETSLTLQGEWLQDRSGYNWYYTPPGGRPTRTWLGEPDFDSFRQSQYQLGYRLEHRPAEALTLRQALRFGHLEIDNDYVYGVTAGRDGRTVSRVWESFSQRLDGLALDNQAELRLRSGALRHRLLAGLDYQQTQWSSLGRGGYAPSLDLASPRYGQRIDRSRSQPSQDGAQRLQQLGLYLQDQLRLQDWVLTLGARQDWLSGRASNRLTGTGSDLAEQATTARLGLTWLGPAGFAPYASYSTSFQPQIGTTAPARGATPYRPSTGTQYELGVKWQRPEGESYVTLAGFRLEQRNATVADADNPGYSLQAGGLRSQGLELEAVAKLDEGLRLAAAYTYQDVEVTRHSDAALLGKRPILVPQRMASLWAEYAVSEGVLEGLGLGAGLRFRGRSYADPQNSRRNDAATLFDAALHYDIDRYRLSLTATNLAGTAVASCQNAICYWGEGRTVLAALRYAW
ncbi:TonB-dependent siderophore receptor [Pseudoroseomonas cervicalis]|uniref:TonB-dependent siderophore receptor n=1 Tax=Teichococcus cervicalis TaxID=204525 RepID=UPI00277DD516|nr:TonB-dependent siderophore receptor [Pseudoroseomonas cervicalis]MDQ1081780.1 iron complex outermembrane receptor protein [Pseudoroseomonas cervicalis]